MTIVEDFYSLAALIVLIILATMTRGTTKKIFQIISLIVAAVFLIKVFTIPLGIFVLLIIYLIFRNQINTIFQKPTQETITPEEPSKEITPPQKKSIWSTVGLVVLFIVQLMFLVLISLGDIDAQYGMTDAHKTQHTYIYWISIAFTLIGDFMITSKTARQKPGIKYMGLVLSFAMMIAALIMFS